MKFVLTGLCSLLFLSANVVSAHETVPRQNALLGLRVTTKGMIYYVYSGGCTSKKDFQIQNLESFPPQLKLVRLNPDHCKDIVPDGEEIFFTWDEVGLEKGTPFKVINSLQNFVVPE